MEIAIELSQLSARRPAPGAAEMWNFQVRATAQDAKGRPTHYYLAPQPDGELLPERYALLKIPAIEMGRTAGKRE
jgi:predicted ArsR family transcriptional regulator